jgi:serine/threonine-protein kinase HipA
MTTSEPPTTAFVWAWLPGAADPVAVGRLDVLPGAGAARQQHAFTYGRRYLEREDAVALFAPELPLRRGQIPPRAGLELPGCLADAGPDAWGRRILEDRHAAAGGAAVELSELTYLLDSGSDRIGALDFQESARDYEPRHVDPVALDELVEAAQRLEDGRDLSPALERALLRGTSIGGARPKALLQDGDRHLIAKFASSSDTGPRVKQEGVAMELARRVGLDVAPTQVVRSMGRDVLLVERFDRTVGGGRRMVVSALTLMGESPMTGHYVTYPEIADLVRATFTDPLPTLRELFSRIVLNVAVGNFDDHARNHAAFWDPRAGAATLTPAYDIDPRPRTSRFAQQALAIGRTPGEHDVRRWPRESRFAVCVDACRSYFLEPAEARAIVDAQVETIRAQWDDAADAAGLTAREREQMWGRQILNDFAFEGLDA